MKRIGIALAIILLMFAAHGQMGTAQDDGEESSGIFVPDIADAWTADRLKKTPADKYLQDIVDPQKTDTRDSRPYDRTSPAHRHTTRPEYAQATGASESDEAAGPNLGFWDGIAPAEPWVIGLLGGSGLAILLIGLLMVRRRRSASRKQILQHEPYYQRQTGSTSRPTLALDLVRHYNHEGQASDDSQEADLDRRAA